MYSLGIQHEVRPSVIAVVQYVGNLGWHQNIQLPFNNFPLTTPNNIRAEVSGGTLPSSIYPAGSNELRTYPGYGTITQEENTTNNTYNGLQASIRLQNKWGLSGELDYTYSHSIDITDGDLSTVDNPWVLKYMKGNTGYDRRQIFGGNYIYNLPIFNKDNGLAHAILGGWQVAGTFVDEGGEPVGSGYSGLNDPIALGGGYTNFANVINPIHYHHKVGDWFDTYANGGVGSLAADPASVSGCRLSLVVRTSASALDERTASSARAVSISQPLFTRTLRSPNGLTSSSARNRTTPSTTPSSAQSTRDILTRRAANMERPLAIGVRVSCSLAPRSCSNQTHV